MARCTYIDGIASSEAIDTAGEIVSLKGLDITSLVSASINFEHESKLPAQIVGKILQAVKIFNEKDCQNDRQIYFWKKCQKPFLYIMGRLFDDKKASSKEVAALFLDDAEHPTEAPMVGFSVEGAKLSAKEGMVITHSIARKVTITAVPANKQCLAEMLPIAETKKDDFASLFKGELFKFEQSYGELLEKKESLEKDVGSGNGAFIGSQLAASEKTPSSHGWSKPNVTHGKIDSGVHYNHPEIGTLSVTKHPSGIFEVSHDKQSQGKFSTPKEAGQYAKKYMMNKSEELEKSRTKDSKQRKRGIITADKTANETSSKAPYDNITPDPRKRDTNFPKRADDRASSITESNKMNKALDAGSAMAAPSALVGGAALGKESLDKKLRKMYKKEKSSWYKRADEAYNTWSDKENFKGYMKKRMPHLADGEIDSIGRVLALKKTKQAEDGLSKMYASYFNKGELHKFPTSQNECNEKLRKGTDIMMASEDSVEVPKNETVFIANNKKRQNPKGASCEVCGGAVNPKTSKKIHHDAERDHAVKANHPKAKTAHIGPDCWNQHPQLHPFEKK